MLTAERLRKVLAYDPETGVFTWRVRIAKNIHVGDLAGTVNARGYQYVTIDRSGLLGHRLAWLWVHGHWPDGQIDHVNRDKSDNRLDNLRCATNTENQHNRYCANRNGHSGLLGVGWYGPRKKWRAGISISGRRKHLGYFETKELAKEFRDLAVAMMRPFSPEART